MLQSPTEANTCEAACPPGVPGGGPDPPGPRGRTPHRHLSQVTQHILPSRQQVIVSPHEPTGAGCHHAILLTLTTGGG